MPRTLITLAALVLAFAIGQAWANRINPRPLVYGHELRDGQHIRFLAERFDLDLGLSIKTADRGWVWVQMEEPDVIYVLAKDAMIECDPACGNVVRLRIRKGR